MSVDVSLNNRLASLIAQPVSRWHVNGARRFRLQTRLNRLLIVIYKSVPMRLEYSFHGSVNGLIVSQYRCLSSKNDQIYAKGGILYQRQMRRDTYAKRTRLAPQGNPTVSQMKSLEL